MLTCLVTFDRRADLGAIGAPTLLLAGEHDRVAPAPMMARMAEKIAHARFATIAGAGHIANLERPQAFNAALAEFLTALPEERTDDSRPHRQAAQPG